MMARAVSGSQDWKGSMAKPRGIITTSESVETARGFVAAGRRRDERSRSTMNPTEASARSDQPLKPCMPGLTINSTAKRPIPIARPSPDADRLAEEERRDGRGGERHDLKDRGGVGDIEVGQRREVDCRRTDLADGTKRDEALGHSSHARESALMPGDESDDRGGDKTAYDDDLRDRKVRARKLHEGVAKGESSDRCEHEKNAAGILAERRNGGHGIRREGVRLYQIT